MRVVMINMADKKRRLAYQRKQFKSLGLSFEAITLQTLPANIPPRYWQSWERPLRPEQRACFLSHRTIWQSIIEINKPALILEDDVLLSKKLKPLLIALDQLGPNPKQYLHMNLEVTNRKKLVSKPFLSPLGNNLNFCHLY